MKNTKLGKVSYPFFSRRTMATLVAGALLPLTVNATVLTFDDLYGNYPISTGYGGFNWNNFYALNGSTLPATGYQSGTVSGSNVAFNAYGNPAALSGSVFDFNGAYLTGAWTDGLNITVVGSLNGSVLYSRTVTVDTHQSTWFDFDFFGIDTLSFSTSNYTQFVMDDFTFNESNAAEIAVDSSWTDATLDLIVGNGGFFGPVVALNEGVNLSEHNLIVDANGRFTQTGGTHTVSGALMNNGSYRLSGGTLSAAGETVGGGFGYGASSTFNQSGGTNTVNGTLTLGSTAGSRGIYNLIAGALNALQEIIGDAGTGTFNQSGGTNTVGDTLTVGKQIGGSGSYNLLGGALTAANEIIGDAGNGTFTQGQNGFGYGSTNQISNTLTLGKQAGSNGTYNLISGSLSANQEIIGDAGNGVFNQSGGSNTVGDTLTLGKQAGSQGSYNLSAGVLAAANEVIGDAGYGSFYQSGGVHTVTNTLTLGKQAGGSGYYNLADGELTANDEVIGDAGYGSFYQSGGTHNINNTLALAKQAGSTGYYTLFGGTLTDKNSVIGDAGYGGFSQGYNSGQFAVEPTHTIADTLILGNKASGYGYYYLNSGKLSAKNQIVGAAGQGWFGQGDYYGYSATKTTNTISGTLTLGQQAGSQGEYHLYSGSLIAANEIVGDAGSGTFTQGEGNFGYNATNNVGDTLTVGKQAGSKGIYNLIDGTLTALREVIGDAGSGTFNQSGGTNTVGETLTLGKQAGGNGTYNLTAGALAAANEIVGDAGTGTFTQGAGNFGYSSTNAVSETLTLGRQAGSNGVYNLIAGALSAAKQIIGDAGVGIFNQSGGTNTVGETLTLGKQAGGDGTYNLAAGALIAANEIVGDAGSGTFTQGAGNFGYSATNAVSGTLTLGKQAGSQGLYNLIAGALTTNSSVVGDAGNGTFNQLGGTHTVADTLTIGKQADGSGLYNLSGGQLTTAKTTVGDAGLGVFTQSGGTHTTQMLTLGKQAGSSGTYYQLGGTLSALAEVIGDAGVGVYTQTGGTHNVGTLTLGKQSGSSGTYNLRGGDLNVTGNIVNGAGTGALLISGGALNFGAGSHDVDVDTLKVSGQGMIKLTDGATTTFEKDVVHNGKAIDLAAGTNAIFNGSFSGKGPFTGAGTATFNSVLNVGDGPVTFNIAGNAILGEHSKSIMEVAGLQRGTGYDAFDIGGALALGGELDLVALNSFQAHLGDVFDLFAAETITGHFDLLSLIALGDGLAWKIDYLIDAVGTTDIVRLSVVNSVPLPGSIWLMQFALAGLAAAARRKRKLA